MSEWKTYKLGDIAEIVGGGTPKTGVAEYWNGNIPWITPRDLTGYKKTFIARGERSISELGLKNSSARLLPKDTVLLTSRAPIGYVAISDCEVTTNQGFKSIVPNKSIIESSFIYYWIKSNNDYLQGLGSGTTFAEISGGVVKEIELDIPIIEEQKAITSVLSSLDIKIDLLRRQNTTLESMAETLFRQWFVEEAQEDWEETTIANLIEFNPPRKLSKNQISTYLDMAGLDTSNFNPTGWYERAFSSGTKFVNKDTLLARITPCLENGKAGYISFLDENEVGWGSTEFIVMRPKLGIHPFFAYVLARYQDFRDYAEGCMEGSSGRQRVNTDHLKLYQIKMPSKEIIQRFNEAVSAITPKLELNANQIQTLEKLRDNLLPKLMNGDVRITSN